MSDELVVVKTFWQASEAHLAKAKLEEAGIQAFLDNEFSVTMTPHLANPSGVRLLVKRGDAQKATEFLEPEK
jgi:hypothetical protein